MKLVSWNVNGVRAALKKGLLDYLATCGADAICLQETKAHPGDVQHVAWPAGYEAIWNSAAKKGYSGTVIFTRTKPQSVMPRSRASSTARLEGAPTATRKSTTSRWRRRTRSAIVWPAAVSDTPR